MGQTARATSILLLAALAFHFAAPTLARQVSCDCSKRGHEIGISCDCPGCLAQRERAGLSCCSFEEKAKSDGKKSAVPSLKPLRCTCGAHDPIATPEGSLPFIPHSGSARFMITLLGPVEIAETPLSLEDVVLSRDHPG